MSETTKGRTLATLAAEMEHDVAAWRFQAAKGGPPPVQAVVAEIESYAAWIREGMRASPDEGRGAEKSSGAIGRTDWEAAFRSLYGTESLIGADNNWENRINHPVLPPMDEVIWQFTSPPPEDEGARPTLAALLDGFDAEIERTANHRIAAQRGGQTVGNFGDFANASPSVLGRLRWWSRAFREAAHLPAPSSPEGA